MALRASLGSSRWRLMRQLLTESIFIAFASAAFGFLLAHWTAPLLVSLLAPSDAPVQLVLEINTRILTFTAVASMITALLFGLVPAWRSSAGDLNSMLKSGGGPASSRQSRSGRIVTMSQIALSLVLVVGAALFVQTLVNLTTMDAGFDRHNVILANVQFRGPDRGQRLSLAWEELRQRVSGSPELNRRVFRLEAYTMAPTATGCSGFLAFRWMFFRTSAGFFGTAGLLLLQGHDFEPRDIDPGAAPVAVISDSLARHFFSDTNPIGRTFSNFEDSPPRWVTVIGVVKDTKFGNLRSPSPLIVYLPYTWLHPPPVMSLVLRARRDVGSLAATLRFEANKADSNFTVLQITTQSKLIDDTLVRERLLAVLGSFFGVLALLMAAGGLYGIMSYTVARRTQEIGIRIALGATRGGVLVMILREAGLMVILGAAVGLAVAQGAAQLVSALLFGVSAHDTATLGIASSVLFVVALVAAFIPARRAAKTDPMVAIRYD